MSGAFRGCVRQLAQWVDLKGIAGVVMIHVCVIIDIFGSNIAKDEIVSKMADDSSRLVKRNTLSADNRDKQVNGDIEAQQVQELHLDLSEDVNREADSCCLRLPYSAAAQSVLNMLSESIRFTW
jgi:hypothetical protein